MSTTEPKIIVVGPGELTLESSFTSMTRQLTECKVTPSTQKKPGVQTLGGGRTASNIDTTWTLSGEFLQDFGAENSVSEWTKEHAGDTVDFTFKPNTEISKHVKGKVTVTATEIGGKVGETATAQFEWDIVGIPTYA